MPDSAAVPPDDPAANDSETGGSETGSSETGGSAADDAPSFFERVWAVVAQIPAGRVTTYGAIAERVGSRSAARTVGWALKAAVGSGLPCHRVVNRYGALTGRRHFPGPHVMEERLRSEGVAFTDEGHVDLDRHFWTPGEGG